MCCARKVLDDTCEFSELHARVDDARGNDCGANVEPLRRPYAKN